MGWKGHGPLPSSRLCLNRQGRGVSEKTVDSFRAEPSFPVHMIHPDIRKWFGRLGEPQSSAQRQAVSTLVRAERLPSVRGGTWHGMEALLSRICPRLRAQGLTHDRAGYGLEMGNLSKLEPQYFLCLANPVLTLTQSRLACRICLKCGAVFLVNHETSQGLSQG